MDRETVEVLRLSLHGTTIGYLAGYQGGRNLLVFDPDYVASTNRPTFTLTGLPAHPASPELYNNPWIRQQRLHPVLSNLLPEGALREWFAQQLKVHPDNEFPLLAQLAADLPGALEAEGVEPDQIPAGILDHRDRIEPVPQTVLADHPHFSLAGVQMKFSMHKNDGRYQISRPGQLGEWIIKTPSTRHVDVPLNEYTAMQLAGLAGVEIPEIDLVPLDKLDDLPPINLPEEKYAFTIRRFDRDENQGRIHTEDLAQVLFKYAHEKYRTTNYESLGKIVREYTGHGLANTQQFARRLLVNILLGNGDAHLKNWTLIYPDQVTAELAPAYDILFTRAYIENEQAFALNLAGSKLWYKASFDSFAKWSEAAGVSWRAIRPHILDTMEQARTLWPKALKESPMNDVHKNALKKHWGALHTDFRIN